MNLQGGASTEEKNPEGSRRCPEDACVIVGGPRQCKILSTHTNDKEKKNKKKEVQIYYLPAAVAVNDRRSAPEGETEKVSGRAM